MAYVVDGLVTVLTVTVLSLGGCPLWREDGSVVYQSQSAVLGQLSVYIIIYILHVLHGIKCTYNIYKATVSHSIYKASVSPIKALSSIKHSYTRENQPPNFGLLILCYKMYFNMYFPLQKIESTFICTVCPQYCRKNQLPAKESKNRGTQKRINCIQEWTVVSFYQCALCFLYHLYFWMHSGGFKTI
jgi:hypothetical protein